MSFLRFLIVGFAGLSLLYGIGSLVKKYGTLNVLVAGFIGACALGIGAFAIYAWQEGSHG